MDLVITATCGPSSYADCGHWDYEAVVNLCADELCEGITQEIARWITPYSRPGRRRWVIDTTPLLGLVAGGGTHYFSFGMVWNMNPSVWDLRFVLRNEGRGAASAEVIPAFAGNRGFNDTYNDEWTTLDFSPPAGTSRVELVAIISGHGQDQDNCAEWCSHQHEFTVNGSGVHLREFPGQVVGQRCAEAVDEGVIAGQRGNWTPGRAGWCPGVARTTMAGGHQRSSDPGCGQHLGLSRAVQRRARDRKSRADKAEQLRCVLSVEGVADPAPGF